MSVFIRCKRCGTLRPPGAVTGGRCSDEFWCRAQKLNVPGPDANVGHFSPTESSSQRNGVEKP
jgi:hypothetical protein